MTKQEFAEIKGYMDTKFEEIQEEQTRRNRWIIGTVLTIVGVILFSGVTIATSIGSLQTRTEIMWKEYVPGDMFITIIHSYDLQNKYILSMMNGDTEEANAKFREFIEFRDQVYNENKRSRGGISPTEGRTMRKTN